LDCTKTGMLTVHFERHTFSSGHEHFKNLYDAIISEAVLKLDYQPYTEASASEKLVHPYLLKEHRNRWFLMGREGENMRLSIYALDRIKKIRNTNTTFIPNDLFDPQSYFDTLIGVSAEYNSKPELIEVKVFKQSAPYIITKPIHHKQVIKKEYKDGSLLIQLELIVNYELRSMLLSYGEGLQVIRPESLKKEIRSMIKKMSSYY